MFPMFLDEQRDLPVVKFVREILASGMHDPNDIFVVLKCKYPNKHYATLRRAIHVAKADLRKEL